MSVPSFVVTNLRDFFRISSIAIGSSRRSFFNPTKRIGTPGHRSFASSIHYAADQYYCPTLEFLSNRPCVSHSPMNLEYPLKIQSAGHGLSSMPMVSSAHNLLVLPCPTMPIGPSGRQLDNLSRSFQTLLVPSKHKVRHGISGRMFGVLT